ncbi:hypothetical protein [Moorena sp. SIO4G3]|uniref:hypothetical protein n=1 Tax=Moorena sp. SIO4G3 TaxID=2607821 RepID=UPI0025F07443|nr:hypothetical protein [Moorena sp. SIO4G3]
MGSSSLLPAPVLMQSASGGNHGKALMGGTTVVAHGGNPLWRRCLPKTALHRWW